MLLFAAEEDTEDLLSHQAHAAENGQVADDQDYFEAAAGDGPVHFCFLVGSNILPFAFCDFQLLLFHGNSVSAWWENSE